jgi:hypothetical protein
LSDSAWLLLSGDRKETILPGDLPSTSVILKAEVFLKEAPDQVLAHKTYTAGELSSEKWNYLRVERPVPGGNYRLKFSLTGSVEKLILSFKFTFDNSIPGSDFFAGGEEKDGDLYLKCLQGTRVPPIYSRLTSSGPFRGHKIQVYEGGIRVPLYFVWPEVIESGKSIQTPVQHIDIYPTLAAIMGAKYEHTVDGKDLSGLVFSDLSLSDRELYWHYPHYMYENGAEAIRDQRYKYIEFYSDGRRELYDLDTDPGEKSNIIEMEPEKAQELKAKLHDWLHTVNARMPLPAGIDKTRKK